MQLYKWINNGLLNKPINNLNKGVYLLIFKGNPKRIIYVGTSNCFSNRMEQHKKGYLEGNRTIWRIKQSDDIYELMSCQGASSKSQRFKYYASLAKKGRLWAHTTIENEKTYNELLKKDSFINNWRLYVESFFINQIEVWTCSMSDSIERILALESKIQRTLQNNYKIESHINGHGMSFLGKIEFMGNLENYKYNFYNFPDLDKTTKDLLKELSIKKVIKYEKKSSRIKLELKQKKIDEARLLYKFAFTKWESLENDILNSCCKLNIKIEIIAHIYLQRTTAEVKNRIKYLARYYKFPNKYKY